MQRVVLMIDIQVFTQGRLIVTEVRLGSLVKMKHIHPAENVII